MTSRIITWSPKAPPMCTSVIAMGVFDGVHLGHQALIRDTVELAGRLDVQACVLTFDRDPDQVVMPENAAPQLMTLSQKVDAIAELGVDTVLIVPFTPELAAMTPASFLVHVVSTAVRPAAIVVGRDFRFGHRAEGDVAVLRADGLARGYEVVGHDLITVDGATVTSTRIRGLVAAGQVVEAAALLGRPHRVTGAVVHGRGIGRRLDAPTLNIAPTPYAALPADGVYAGRAVTPLGTYRAGVSVGVPPTFPEATDRFEAHLLDFEGDLYDATVTIEFVERLREQRAFDNQADLAAAIAADMERVRLLP